MRANQSSMGLSESFERSGGQTKVFPNIYQSEMTRDE